MKKRGSFFLALILLFTLTTASAAPLATQEQGLVKDETVYANLNADGSLREIYVVNRLETLKAGEYTDYGNYSQILNLSGVDSPSIHGDEIIWEAVGDVLYYQGNLEQGELPFTFSLEYTLDSNPISPSEAVGKSGAIAIALKIEPNPRSKAYFRENYVAQIQIPIDLEAVSDLLAPGATSVLAGKTATLAYTVLPKQKAEYTLSFKTAKFEMESISISCIPFDTSSFLEFDTEEITTGFGQLAGGFDQLVGGSKGLRDGLSDLTHGLGRLSGGADQVAAGTDELATNIPQLLAGAQALQQGALSLDYGIDQLGQGTAGLAAGATDLATGIGNYVLGAGQIAQNTEALSGGLSQLALEGTNLNNGYAQLVEGLNGALLGLPNQLASLGLTPEQQQALGGILTEMGMDLNTQLVAVGQGLQGYSSGVNQAALGCGGLAEGLTGFAAQGQLLAGAADQLAGGATGISENFGPLGMGSSQLASGLTSFVEQSQSLGAGTEQLSSGAYSVAGGLNEIANGSKRLPSDVQALIDAQVRMKEAFASAAGLVADFELPEGDQKPVSFVTDKISPRSVQFIASTPALKIKTETIPLPVETEKSNGFFARLLRLFGIGK